MHLPRDLRRVLLGRSVSIVTPSFAACFRSRRICVRFFCGRVARKSSNVAKRVIVPVVLARRDAA